MSVRPKSAFSVREFFVWSAKSMATLARLQVSGQNYWFYKNKSFRLPTEYHKHQIASIDKNIAQNYDQFTMQKRNSEYSQLGTAIDTKMVFYISLLGQRTTSFREFFTFSSLKKKRNFEIAPRPVWNLAKNSKNVFNSPLFMTFRFPRVLWPFVLKKCFKVLFGVS